MSGFDVVRFAEALRHGHGGRVGIGYHAHGTEPDAHWVELALPYHPDLIGDPESGVIASGPIATLMDMATSMAVWRRRGRFLPHATLDLRIDYLRAARPLQTVVGRGECYRLGRSIAFVRGQAHDGDPDDPVAHVAGTFMLMDGWA
ncbi:hypothetical protein GCM10011380_10100 [Sphingomonas metalli]|uniref:Thioesterase domain-containing protein n=1 Tax=Sphingomonas metalli TaxID=1779358 RepID=A0A916SXV0_9SPHN|nr:PaaI family thioesterase [Sphingomonas metalli]GGB22494.1 hypothetical protein GCM10011380_10100 [Sphingomonas metalli]